MAIKTDAHFICFHCQDTGHGLREKLSIPHIEPRLMRWLQWGGQREPLLNSSLSERRINLCVDVRKSQWNSSEKMSSCALRHSMRSSRWSLSVVPERATYAACNGPSWVQAT